MNITMLPGKLLVTRDPPETFKQIEAIDDQGNKRVAIIYFPDDMGGREGDGVNSWAASDRLRCTGFCHLHEPRWSWIHDPNLTGMRVYFEKWSERTFEYNGHTFHVFDERAIFAYEETVDEDH